KSRMLWRAMLRCTSTALIAQGCTAAGGDIARANVEDVRDRPVAAAATPQVNISVYVDDRSESIGGGAPGFRTYGTVTIETVIEADSRAAARDLRDCVTELVKNVLLTGQG